MSLVVTDEPPDRPEWIAETVRLVSAQVVRERGRLLERVATATDEALAAGTPETGGSGRWRPIS